MQCQRQFAEEREGGNCTGADAVLGSHKSVAPVSCASPVSLQCRWAELAWPDAKRVPHLQNEAKYLWSDPASKSRFTQPKGLGRASKTRNDRPVGPSVGCRGILPGLGAMKCLQGHVDDNIHHVVHHRIAIFMVGFAHRFTHNGLSLESGIFASLNVWVFAGGTPGGWPGKNGP